MLTLSLYIHDHMYVLASLHWQVYICAGGQDLPPVAMLKKLLEAAGGRVCSSVRSATLCLVGSEAKDWLAGQQSVSGGPNK